MPPNEDADPALPPLYDGLHQAEQLQAEGNLAEAAGLLVRLWAANADSPHAPARGAALLLHLQQTDAAEALIEEGLAAFPSLEAFHVDHARAAEQRGAVRTAAARWAMVRSRFPDNWQAYAAGAAMLRAAGRDAEGEEVLRAGTARLPQKLELWVDFARAAEQRGDLSAAKERWARANAASPDAVIGYLGLSAALRQSGSPDEAASVLGSALERWAGDRDVLSERARLAEAGGDWAEAAAWWAKARAADPYSWPAWVEGGLALQRSGDADGARAVLAEAADRFPAEPAPLVFLGRLHDAVGDWAGAAGTWEAVRARFAHLKDGHVGQGKALRMLVRHAEAEAALAEAARLFPNDRDTMLELVHLAYDRADWPAAAAACAAGAALFPDDNEFRRRSFEIHLRSVDAATEVAAPVPAVAGGTDDRDLLMRFESLGGTGHGCEFGIFQRESGAEPLGLLRWTDLRQDQLSDALESEFEGVGTPEQTVIFVPETTLRKQYWTNDRRFGMVSGTSVYLDEVSEEKLFPHYAGACSSCGAR